MRLAPIEESFGDQKGPLSPFLLWKVGIFREYVGRLRESGLHGGEEDGPSGEGVGEAGREGEGIGKEIQEKEKEQKKEQEKEQEKGEQQEQKQEDKKEKHDLEEERHQELGHEGLLHACQTNRTTTARLLLQWCSPNGSPQPSPHNPTGAPPTAPLTQTQVLKARRRALTPLHMAARNGNLEVVTLLIDHGAKIQANNVHRISPAFLAAGVSAETLRVLIERGTSLKILDQNRQTLLHAASRAGNLECVKVLVEDFKVEVNVWDRWSRTPVHWGVLNGHGGVVEYLFGKGAEVNPNLSLRAHKMRTTLPQESPLHIAARVHGVESEMYGLLKRWGGDEEAVDQYGRVPGHWEGRRKEEREREEKGEEEGEEGGEEGGEGEDVK